MPASKKPKSKVGASSAAAEESVASSTKKTTSSGVSTKKEAASSSKRPALCKPTVVSAPSSTEKVEVEFSPEPVKRKNEKMMIKELEPAASKVAPSDPSPSGSKDVPIPQTRVVPESEMTPGAPVGPLDENSQRRLFR